MKKPDGGGEENWVLCDPEVTGMCVCVSQGTWGHGNRLSRRGRSARPEAWRPVQVTRAVWGSAGRGDAPGEERWMQAGTGASPLPHGRGRVSATLAKRNESRKKQKTLSVFAC